MYKLRTVDVWDTLLRRNCHPECIKLATAQHLLLTQYNNIATEYQNHWDLYYARIAIERHLGAESYATGKDDEYKIIDVLNQWFNKVFIDSYDRQLSHQIAEYELSTEIARSFPDPDITEFLKKFPAEHTLFLSDFYMNAAMLNRLLACKNFDRLIPDGISSSDIGLNKRSGNLFHFIHKTYSIAPEHHIHIGDNSWSDISVANQIGIKTVHYLPTTAHTQRLERERLFSSREALFEYIKTLSIKNGTSIIAEKIGKQAIPFQLGIDVAPLFIGFALWIAERALIEKVDQLYFLTREGEFFYQVFTTMFPQHVLGGHKLPPTHILAVSRLSTFAASMQDASIQEMSRIWDLFKSQSVLGLFVTLGIPIEEFAQVFEQIGLQAQDVIDQPQHSQTLKKLFSIPKFIDALQHSIHRQRVLVYDYLVENGFQSSNRIGVVDIGWRGTIQDNLALIMPQIHFSGMYLGLRKFINLQPANVSKSAYGPDENICSQWGFLFEIFSMLEMLCNSDNGSVEGYSRRHDRIIPCRQTIKEERIAYEQFIKDFQQGVLFAAQNWQPYLERYVVTANEIRDIALRIWKALQQNPSHDLAELFIRTPQHDVFGFGDLFHRNQAPSLLTILGSPFSHIKRSQLIEFIRRLQWSTAIQHMQGVNWFHRLVLILIFRLAHQFRRIRMKIRYIKSKI